MMDSRLACGRRYRRTAGGLLRFSVLPCTVCLGMLQSSLPELDLDPQLRSQPVSYDEDGSCCRTKQRNKKVKLTIKLSESLRAEIHTYMGHFLDAPHLSHPAVQTWQMPCGHYSATWRAGSGGAAPSASQIDTS